MLKYRYNINCIDVWSTTVDSLCITIKTENVLESYLNEGITWKEAMLKYASELTALMCEKFRKEDKLEVEITASRLAYRVIEERRFNKKYNPDCKIAYLFTDYNQGIKEHEGSCNWFWEEVMRKYVQY